MHSLTHVSSHCCCWTVCHTHGSSVFVTLLWLAFCPDLKQTVCESSIMWNQWLETRIFTLPFLLTIPVLPFDGQRTASGWQLTCFFFLFLPAFFSSCLHEKNEKSLIFDDKRKCLFTENVTFEMPWSGDRESKWRRRSALLPSLYSFFFSVFRWPVSQIVTIG